MLHVGVIVALRFFLLDVAQGNRHHPGAAGRAKTTPQQLFGGCRLRHRSGHRHGEHVEQHCEAGYPGNCEPLSGHGTNPLGGRSGAGYLA